MSTLVRTPIRVGLIGAGGVMDLHHVPGLRLDGRCRLSMICDTDADLAARRGRQWGVEHVTDDYRDVCTGSQVDAVIIATPNFTHAPIAIAAAQGGKHIMCEKPLGLNGDEVWSMVRAARDAGVVHMTAFTYRFAPAMRWMRHMMIAGTLGEPRHFRSQRFLDWPETSWGWRQYRRTAGAGDLFDMTIHRIDFAIDLLGPIREVCGAVARFTPRAVTESGAACDPSEVDDWSAMIGRFVCGAFGVWEGTTLAKGYGRNGFGHEWAEINGSEGTAVYRLHDPNRIMLGKTGQDLAPVDVPREFLAPPGTPRDPADGEPATVFRYDVVWEFISAICEGRNAVPDFHDGLRAQIVADAVLESFEKRRWVEIAAERD